MFSREGLKEWRERDRQKASSVTLVFTPQSSRSSQEKKGARNPDTVLLLTTPLSISVPIIKVSAYLHPYNKQQS